MSDSPGLVDFAIGLLKSVLNVSDGQMNSFFRKFSVQKNCNQSCSAKFFSDWLTPFLPRMYKYVLCEVTQQPKTYMLQVKFDFRLNIFNLGRFSISIFPSPNYSWIRDLETKEIENQLRLNQNIYVSRQMKSLRSFELPEEMNSSGWERSGWLLGEFGSGRQGVKMTLGLVHAAV